MVENGIKFIPKNPPKFICNFCDYLTSNSKDFKKHTETLKHKKRTNDSKMIENDNKFSQNNVCYCGKSYKYNSGYYRHKKKCNISEPLLESNVILQYQQKIDKLTDVVLDIVNKNSELTKQIIELSSKSNSISNSNINISNNKTFNLNVFLNEECKNALNIRDFVESIQIQLSDLENTGKVGYVEGISQIFINNLERLNNHERPIHCSDYKREVLYIKNENEWIKETEDKQTIKNAIKQVANKNIKKIKCWQEKHPNYNDPNSKQNDKYMKIVLNSMSGSTEEEQKHNINKIIKNVAKEVIIEK
jgi:hypothetical protein